MITFRPFTKEDWYGFCGAEGNARMAVTDGPWLDNWEVVLDDNGCGAYLYEEAAPGHPDSDVLTLSWHLECSDLTEAAWAHLLGQVEFGKGRAAGAQLEALGFQQVEG